MEKLPNPESKKQKVSGLEISNYSHVNDTMKIIYGTKDAVTKGIQFMNNVTRKMDLCYDSNAPSIVINVSEYKEGYINIRKRGGKIRVITEITKGNIKYCKELMKIVDEMKHLNNIKGGTAINDSEYMATNILHESKPLTQVVYSNVRDVVEQQQNFFDSLWDIAIPAKQKIKEITDELKQKEIDVFSVLDNKIRRLIIFYINEKNLTMSQLAKKLDMTLQALQKHFSKLIDSKIIEKRSDGNIVLTNIGKMIVKQIPTIQFISENTEFLRTHDLIILPKEFFQRIDEFQDIEILSYKETPTMDDLFCEEIKYLKIIAIQGCFNLRKKFISKLLERKTRIDYISDKNTIILKEGLQETGTNIHDEYFGRKTVLDAPLALALSNKAVYVAFKKNDKKIDAHNIIFSEDTKLISWCNDFFEYTWSKYG